MEIIHNKIDKNFSVTIEEGEARLSYKSINDHLVEAYSTYVPDQARGLGLGGRLARDFFEFVKRKNLKVRPSCSYVEMYMSKHPDMQNLRE